MINVNQITSMLSRMALPDLQKYAAMHKNDPYIVTLAMSVANQKKQAEIAKNGMAGMQPQPKVVDQQIAQMVAPPPQQQMPQQQMPQQQMPPQMAQQQLPEDSGIGQLPAQNMQGIADGGIVGYAEGGHIPSYAGQTDGSFVYQNSYQYAPNQIGLTNPDGTPMTAAQLNALPEAERMRIAKELREATGRGPMPTGVNPVIPYAPNSGYGNGKLPLPLADIYKAQREKGITALGKQPDIVMPAGPGVSGIDLGGPGAYPGTGGGANPTVGEPLAAKPTTGQPGARPGAKPPATKLPAATPTASSGQGIKTEPSAGLPSVAAFADQLMGIDKFLPKKEEAPVKETFMKEREDISRPVYEKATAMLEKEKSRLNEGKEQDFYMALIEGGLEAAAGNSPNGLQNLAAGFSKGAKSYSVALKDFRKAAQENSKMELDMERARAAEKRGDMDAFQKYEDSVKNRNADIDKLKTSGIFALQNVHTSGAYQLQSTGMTTSSQEKIAKLSRDTQVAIASMAGPQERLFATLGGGKDQASVLKGLQRFQEAQTDKTGLGFAKLYVDHVAEANKAGTAPMSEAVFLDTMTRLASQFNPKTVTDPGKGTVLDRPR